MKRIVSFGFLMSLASHGFGKDTVRGTMHSVEVALTSMTPQGQDKIALSQGVASDLPGTSKHIESAVESDLVESRSGTASLTAQINQDELSKETAAANQLSQSKTDSVQKTSSTATSAEQPELSQSTKVSPETSSSESQSSLQVQSAKASDSESSSSIDPETNSQSAESKSTTATTAPSASIETKKTVGESSDEGKTAVAEKTSTAPGSEAMTKAPEGQATSENKTGSEIKTSSENKAVAESTIVAEGKPENENQTESLSDGEKKEGDTAEASVNDEAAASGSSAVGETKTESYSAPVSTIDMGRTKAIYAEKDKSVNHFGSWMIQISTGNKVNYSEIKRYKEFYGDFASTLDFGVDWNFVRTTYAGFGLGGRFSYYSDKGTRLKKESSEKVEGDTTFAVNSGILGLQAYASPFVRHWLVLKGWAGKQFDYFEESRDSDAETTTVSEAQDSGVLISKGKRNGLVRGAAFLVDLSWASSESLKSMKPSLGFDELYLGAFKESYSHLSTAGLNLSRDMTGLMLVFGSAY